jgi:cytochrome P450
LFTSFNYDFKSLEDQDTVLGPAFREKCRQLFSTSWYALFRLVFESVEPIGSFFLKEQMELDKAKAVVDDISQKLVNEAKRRALESVNGTVKADDIQGNDLLSLLVRSNMSVDVNESERLRNDEMVSMVPTFLVVSGLTRLCEFMFPSLLTVLTVPV